MGWQGGGLLGVPAGCRSVGLPVWCAADSSRAGGVCWSRAAAPVRPGRLRSGSVSVRARRILAVSAHAPRAPATQHGSRAVLPGGSPRLRTHPFPGLQRPGRRGWLPACARRVSGGGGCGARRREVRRRGAGPTRNADPPTGRAKTERHGAGPRRSGAGPTRSANRGGRPTATGTARTARARPPATSPGPRRAPARRSPPRCARSPPCRTRASSPPPCPAAGPT